jgi:hypothetical protein
LAGGFTPLEAGCLVHTFYQGGPHLYGTREDVKAKKRMESKCKHFEDVETAGGTTTVGQVAEAIDRLEQSQGKCSQNFRFSKTSTFSTFTWNLRKNFSDFYFHFHPSKTITPTSTS